MELPMIDVAAIKANCSSGIENYHLCDRCYATGSHDVIRLVFYVVAHAVREPTCMWQVVCDKSQHVVVVVYLSLSSGEFISTSSHIHCSWYLPVFLFRDGPLTLMKMTSLMDLAMYWCSLATELNLSMDISCPVVL